MEQRRRPSQRRRLLISPGNGDLEETTAPALGSLFLPESPGIVGEGHILFVVTVHPEAPCRRADWIVHQTVILAFWTGPHFPLSPSTCHSFRIHQGQTPLTTPEPSFPESYRRQAPSAMARSGSARGFVCLIPLATYHTLSWLIPEVNTVIEELSKSYRNSDQSQDPSWS